MYCPKCGAQVDQGSSYCQKCGAAVEQPVVAQPQGATAPPMSGQVVPVTKTSGMAIASLVLGLVGFFVFPFIPSVLAIIFGAIGMGQINRSNGAVKGKGMAVAGIILGIVGIIIMVLVVVLVGYSMTWITDFANDFNY